jgi:uncharacterized protein YegL
MPVKIFFCYAHEDEPLLNKLKTHLRPLQRMGVIDIWHDRDISAGTKWEEEINKHLNEANMILLLVSPDFMDSDYCYGIEMQRALERDQRGEARVIPIILRPVHWQGTPIGKLQALPTNAKPVKSWPDLDDAFYDTVAGIQEAMEKIRTQSIKEIDQNEKVHKTSKDTVGVVPLNLPGGAIRARPLYLIWLIDSSGSMSGDKMRAVNSGIKEVIPEIMRIMHNIQYAEVFVQAIRFSSGAKWHLVGYTSLENIQWPEVHAGGVTDLGRGLELVAIELGEIPLRSLPPVLILITDGYPTDDYSSGIHALFSKPWGRRAIRYAIGIGDDIDIGTLQTFIANPDITPLRAKDAQAIVDSIKLATLKAVQEAASHADD